MTAKTSSASSGTRKKNAAKKAGKNKQGQDGGGDDQADGPSSSSHPGPHLSKKDKNAQKIKRGQPKPYTPPPKPPAPAVPDPLDALGLGTTLPAELVVVLRKLGKKDEVTRRRALEDLAGWLARVQRRRQRDEKAEKAAAGGVEEQQGSKEKEGKEEEVELIEGAQDEENDENADGWWVDMIGPIWLHHLPSLLLSPRLTSLTLQTHSLLLTLLPNLLPATLPYLLEHQQRNVLGSYIISTLLHPTRSSSNSNQSPFDPSLTWSPSPDASPNETLDLQSYLPLLTTYVSMSILESGELWESVFPPVVSFVEGKDKKTGGYRGRIEQGGGAAAARAAGGDEDAGREVAEKDEREVGLKIGGLVGLSWILRELPSSTTAPSSLPEDLSALLSSSQLWSSLASASSSEPAQSQPLGLAQPAIRKVAWDVLRAAVLRWPDLIRTNLQTLSNVILQNCWVESDQGTLRAMWEPLLLFLTKFPVSWLLEKKAPPPVVEDIEEDDEGEDGDDREKGETKIAQALGVAPPTSLAFAGFLDFLKNGCRGSSQQGYPTLVVILSTIPVEIFPLTTPSLTTLFDALWSAYPSLLNSTVLPSPSQSFLVATLECNAYLLQKRLRAGDAGASAFAAVQVEKCWLDGVIGAAVGGTGPGRRRKVVPRGRGGVAGEDQAGKEEAKFMGRGLEKVFSVDEATGNAAWSSIISSTINLLTNSTLSSNESTKTPLPLPKLAPLLSALRITLPEILVDSFESMLGVISRLVVGSVMQEMGDFEDDAEIEESRMESAVERVGLVVELVSLEKFAVVLREDDVFVRVFDALLANETVNLLKLLPPSSAARLYRLAFTWRVDPESDVEIFEGLTAALSPSSTLENEARLAVLKSLVADGTPLPAALGVKEDGSEVSSLDEAFSTLAESVLEGAASSEEVDVLKALMINPRPFVSQAQADLVFQRILSTFTLAVQTMLVDGITTSLTNKTTSILLLLQSYLPIRPIDANLAGEFVRNTVEAIFDAAFLLHHTSDEESIEDLAELAHSVWTIVRGASAAGSVLGDLVVEGLKSKLRDTRCRVSVESLLLAVDEVNSSSLLVLTSSLLPTSTEMISQISTLSLSKIAPALAVIDPLVPQLPEGSPARSAESDLYGYSTFARLATAVSLILSSDRSLLRSNPEWIRVISTYNLFASDELAVPGSSKHVFGAEIARGELEAIVKTGDALRSYALSATAGSLEVGWHQASIAAIGSAKTEGKDGVCALLGELVEAAREGEDIYASRVLRDLLAGVLQYSGAGVAEAEAWLMFGRTLQDKAPQVSLAIVYAAKDLCLESPRMDRFQNELAADLAGFKASAVNTKGLRYLRLLAATAPPPDSTAIFLPQRRTVMLMQTLQEWMTSDEDDLSEELDSRVAETFLHLAPIAQNDLGSHWEFVFDLLEANLEAATWEDPSTLPFLAHTLRLLTVVRDLASTNKILNELWVSRRDASLALVFGLFISEAGSSNSEPLSICRGMIIELVSDMTASSLTPDRMGPLFELLKDSSVDIQITAHTLLQRMIKAQTSDLVVKVELETETPITVSLPKELIEILSSGLEGSKALPAEAAHMQISTYLLAWKLVFDFFEDASLRMKTSYVEQLRNAGLIGLAFLPSIFSILDVAETSTRPFDLGPWAVDEFVIELYDPENENALPVLAAYLYYRALIHVPSLIRIWWLECKDRQLSMAVASFTSRHFSPVIVDHELSTLRQPDAMAQLQDENLTVKILPAANEVTASYVVDEQPMEIAVRLPPDYPLHGVEVKDLRRVGVPEAKWRAWLLAVQQVVTSRDGLILDALTLFKRNVSLHFAGVTDCAICYSIISVSDRTLPNRTCKTCSNKFHASCLYKWFNTSHSSSCPLCRSLF